MASVQQGNGAPIRPTRVEQEGAQENIFLFIPNLIGTPESLTPPSCLANKPLGYSRVVLAVVSLYYMPLHPRTCTLLYSISCLLDALDGYAARKYEQSTKFGAVLDMVTDRCTTTCLLVFLAQAFPRWSIVFQGLISLDLASHYMHMYATLSMGGTNQSHKNVDESRSWLLKQYYSNNVRLPIPGNSTGKNAHINKFYRKSSSPSAP
jgi:CDP-diacylglycerol--inositol 3-phosphatidyltransferase